MRKLIIAIGMATLLSVTAQAAPSTVYLENPSWNSVNIEVRVGSSVPCDSNAVEGTHSVLRDKSYAVTTSSNIVCYRRDLDPDHPNGQYGDWHEIDINPQDHEYHIKID